METNDKLDEKRQHYATAINYLVSRREKSSEGDGKTYPLNRGDLMILVMLIDQDMDAVPPAADLKRLAAIRNKLGDLVFATPEMSKEEAREFREDNAA